MTPVRPVWVAGDVEQAPVGDAHAVQPGAPRVRAVLAEHADARPHQLWPAVVGSDVPGLQGARSEVLAHHVGDRGQPAEQVLTLRCAQVESYALAAPAFDRPPERVVVEIWADRAHEVATAGLLHLDHLGAELAEQAGAEGGGDPGPYVENQSPGEREVVGHDRGSPSTRSPMMLRWISLVPAKIDDAW